MKLYFAPLNIYGNYLYRHLMLENGADKVFSEMIRCDNFFQKEIDNEKLKVYKKEELKHTIFQIAASNIDQVKKILPYIKGTKELNLNMGCPHSSFQKMQICSGILFNKELMKQLTKEFASLCKQHNLIPSIKLRLGTNLNNIEIGEYLNILENSKIKKVYIHARTLKHPYEKPANYNFQISTKLEVVLNGDIDSYKKAKQIINKFPQIKGLMIGRAAISDPLIFNKIKQEQDYNKTTQINGKHYLNNTYKPILKQFLKLSKNSRFQEINLKPLLKGISNKKELIRDLSS